MTLYIIFEDNSQMTIHNVDYFSESQDDYIIYFNTAMRNSKINKHLVKYIGDDDAIVSFYKN